MSVVYRARQLSLSGRTVALKVLPLELQTDIRRKRFSKEAQLLSRLHHECLADVYGYGEADGALYYAMRLVEGVSLQEYLDQIRSTRSDLDIAQYEACCLRWFIDVARALAAVHAAGLVHRDVKPANIVLEGVERLDGPLDQFRAVLVDFGLVRSLVSQTRTLDGYEAGTPVYAPPEQLLGLEVDTRSDVFALGVTMHDLLARRGAHERPPPSRGLELLSLLVPGVSRDLEAIVGKAADPAAHWRYADGAALLQDLQSFRDGRPVAARFRPLRERAWRWIGKYRKGLVRWAAVVALLVAASAIAAYPIRWSRDWHLAVAALRSVQLGAASNHLGNLPGLMVSLLPSDVELIGRRIYNADPDDPYTQMIANLSSGDVQAALFSAATQIRLDGPSADPAIDALLIGCLQMAQRRDGLTPSQDLALRLVSRVLFERFDYEGAEIGRRTAFRECLWIQWRDPDLSRDDRLVVLSGISGCGVVEDVESLVTWAATQPLLSEEQRLGFASASRIVLRSLYAGMTDGLPTDAVWDVLAPVLLEQFSRSAPAVDSPEDEALGAMLELGAALAVVDRARAGRMQLPEQLGFLCGEAADQVCLDKLHASGLAVGHVRDHAFAALGCRCIAAEQVSLLAQQSVPEAASVIGLTLALLQDTRAIAAARELATRRDAESGQAGFLKMFDAGVSGISATLRGDISSRQPDEESCLGYAWPQSSGVSLIVEPDPHLIDLASGTVARWDFRSTFARVGGGATGAAIERVTHSGQDEVSLTEHCLVLRDFGASVVQLDFTLIRRVRALELELTHLSAQRPNLPFGGVCHLSIVLDGTVVAEDLTVTVRLENHAATTWLPAAFLEPGTHCVEIRLLDNTTTTYRLYAVTLTERGR